MYGGDTANNNNNDNKIYIEMLIKIWEVHLAHSKSINGGILVFIPKKTKKKVV